MKRTLFLLFLFIAAATFAKDVTEEQARRVAYQFWQSSPATRGGTPVLQMVFHSEGLATRQPGAAPAYYVFDNTAGPGFVVVAGDDVALPVLGYSFEHEFSADRLPPNLKEWLEQLRQEVNDMRRDGVEASADVSRRWTSTRAGAPVVKLETARWNQAAPYNQLCPTVNGNSTYTGCTATALAIVMRYHRWPEKGVGTLPGYTTTTYQKPVSDLTLGHTYDWDNMLLDYPMTGYSQTAANAVATLMRDCGIMLQSDFCPIGSAGTAASISYIPPGLTTYMGYDKNIRAVPRDAYSATEWQQLMADELDHNRPVLYTGANAEAGHAFVLDGYTDDYYFSVNWGWGGYCDGYFLLSAMDPEGQGAGGSGSYNENQYAVIGIQKDSGAGVQVEELRFMKNVYEGYEYKGLSVGGEVRTGEPFTLYFGFLFNNGVAAFNGDLRLVMADRDGNWVEEFGQMAIEELPAGYGYMSYGEFVIQSPILPGYRIRAYYRSVHNPEWKVVRGNEEEDCVWDLLIGDPYTIEETTRLTYNKTSRLLKLQVKEGVTAQLHSADGNDLSDLCGTQGNEISIDASALPGGTYRLTLRKGSEEKRLNLSLPDVTP